MLGVPWGCIGRSEARSVVGWGLLVRGCVFVDMLVLCWGWWPGRGGVLAWCLGIRYSVFGNVWVRLGRLVLLGGGVGSRL